MDSLASQYPKWSKRVLVAIYALPLAAVVVYTIIVLGIQGIVTLLMGFIPSLLIGSFIFLPFAGMYYAVISCAHTLFDQFRFRSPLKRGCARNILISVVCSGILMTSSILFIPDFDLIPFIFLCLGIGATAIFTIVRAGLIRLKA
jgi:hypothetical protein